MADVSMLELALLGVGLVAGSWGIADQNDMLAGVGIGVVATDAISILLKNIR